jgi:hypothetical protein
VGWALVWVQIEQLLLLLLLLLAELGLKGPELLLLLLAELGLPLPAELGFL